MNGREARLQGVNARIAEALEENRSLQRRYGLESMIANLEELLSEPSPTKAVSIIRRILKKHGKDIFGDYMARLAEIETAIQRFNPGLRDHVNHSVYVFLLGLLLETNFSLIKVRRALTWKLATFLHDVGYPIELFSRSTGDYLGQVHSLRNEIVEDSRYTAPTHSIDIENLENLASGRNAFELMNSRLAKWGLCVDLKQIYEKKMKRGVVDHGILSSIVVLNIIDALYYRYNPVILRDL